MVFAAADEIHDKQVTVTKKNGETQLVKVSKVSRPYVGKFGQYAGVMCVYATPVKDFVSRRSRKDRLGSGHEDQPRWFDESD